MNLFSIRSHDYVQRRPRKLLIIVVLLAAFFATSLGTAQAYTTYEGGDWGDMDFMPANGDVLSGTFTNIGRFIINAGDTIYAGSSNLTLFTNEALINGTLYGGATLSPSLNLTSEGNLTLTSTGILDQWTSIYLASGSGIMTLNGAINTLNSGSTSLPPEQIVISPGGAVFIDGGGLTLTPVPLPPAVLLFGSGLLAMGLARRRLKVWDEVEAELVQFIKGAPTAMTRPATSRQTGRKISLTEL